MKTLDRVRPWLCESAARKIMPPMSVMVCDVDTSWKEDQHEQSLMLYNVSRFISWCFFIARGR